MINVMNVLDFQERCLYELCFRFRMVLEAVGSDQDARLQPHDIRPSDLDPLEHLRIDHLAMADLRSLMEACPRLQS